MRYVLWRTDQGRGWVTRAGSPGSYTGKLQQARTFATREDAERNRCPGNEIVQSLEEATDAGTLP
jgi:hypothetical protein